MPTPQVSDEGLSPQVRDIWEAQRRCDGRLSPLARPLFSVYDSRVWIRAQYEARASQLAQRSMATKVGLRAQAGDRSVESDNV